MNELLHLTDTNVNALTRDHKTALDIAEGLPLSEESSNIKDCLNRYGAVRANILMMNVTSVTFGQRKSTGQQSPSNDKLGNIYS